MTVNTPRLGLPKGQGADNARDYLKGAISGGGLWRALEILDNAILEGSVNELDDVTLTSPNIGADQWTDANHSHASAATAGSTLGPGTTLSAPTLQTPAVSGVMTFGGDATLQRSAAGTLLATGHLSATGVVAAASVLAAGSAGTATGGLVRLVDDGGTIRYLAGIPNVAAARDYVVYDVPAAQSRLTVSSAGDASLSGGAGVSLVRASSGGSVHLNTNASGFVHPLVDASSNLGHPTYRFVSVYAFNGAINTSSRAHKEGITPLDPARAMEAVRNTEAVSFAYVTPPAGPEAYALPDDPEEAQRVLEERLSAAPLLEGARHQHGFIAEDADELLLVGEGQTSPGNTCGVLLAALQHLDARLTALEGAP